MSWQIQQGLRKWTLAVPCAIRNIFHLKSFIGPTPQIMLFNLHNDLLNRHVQNSTLNILFINTLVFFFNGKPAEKYVFEVDYLFWEQLLSFLMETTVDALHQQALSTLRQYCGGTVGSYHAFLTWYFITVHLIKCTDECPSESLNTRKTGCVLLEKFLSKWHLYVWKIIPILGNFR